MAKIHLGEDFREFIELLNKNNVEFLIVGAYAVGFHGYVRFTGDLDVWVNPSPENASKVFQCLKDFGFGSVSGLNVEDFAKVDSVVQLGYEKKENTIIDGTKVPFLDLESLKVNKASTNRNKDLGDLENLP